MKSIELVAQWWIDETYNVMHPNDSGLKGWSGFVEYWQSLIRNRHLNKMDLEDYFCDIKEYSQSHKVNQSELEKAIAVTFLSFPCPNGNWDKENNKEAKRLAN